MTKALPGTSPYLVMNETGVIMSVFASDTLKVLFHFFSFLY